MEIEVKGHSGCQIEIVNGGDSLFINKSTHDKKYIPRLYRQALKQQEAGKVVYQHIRIPEIYEIEKTDDCLNVRMEYVYSKNYVDYFEDAGFDQISYFVKALKIFIDSELEHSKLTSINRNVILEKFKDICVKVQANNMINKDKEIVQILERSALIFNSVDEEIRIPVGYCHGDLTFSNILFNGNNYYLIDFLDSFIESPLLDIVKIRQDSRYAWSQQMYEYDMDVVRMKIISGKIDEEIDKYYSRYDWYRKNYSMFQLMNFLRIIQYVKDEKVLKFLKQVLISML
jgi:thiamine kinase-like enzyme